MGETCVGEKKKFTSVQGNLFARLLRQQLSGYPLIPSCPSGGFCARLQHPTELSASCLAGGQRLYRDHKLAGRAKHGELESSGPHPGSARSTRTDRQLRLECKTHDRLADLWCSARLLEHRSAINGRPKPPPRKGPPQEAAGISESTAFTTGMRVAHLLGGGVTATARDPHYCTSLTNPGGRSDGALVGGLGTAEALGMS